MATPEVTEPTLPEAGTDFPADPMVEDGGASDAETGNKEDIVMEDQADSVAPETVAGDGEETGAVGDPVEKTEADSQPKRRGGGRKKDRATVLKEEGLSKTNNGLELSSWPQISMINQKNYYTDYLKKEEQYLSFRTAQEQLAKEKAERDQAEKNAANGVEEVDKKPIHGSRNIVIHPGSQNLRIGYSNEALPKTVPMVIARRVMPGSPETDGHPRPYRLSNKTAEDDEDGSLDHTTLFGPEFDDNITEMAANLKKLMKANKRRVLPNSQELAVNFNIKSTPTPIIAHNDSQQVEWTEVDEKNPQLLFCGEEALRIADKIDGSSEPGYHLFWPVRYGMLNEGPEYQSQSEVWDDFFEIIEYAIKSQLGLKQRRGWKDYSVCFIIPDLYDRNYVTTVLDRLLHRMGFSRVCFLQESVAATFGAGYSQACIVDVGAQCTTVCCVEDGLCVEESRVRLSLGGSDVTDVFTRFLLYSAFPYGEVDLAKRQDWQLLEGVKKSYCILDDGLVSGQTAKIHTRHPKKDTLEYVFKLYQEPMLAPLTLFEPTILAVGKVDSFADDGEESEAAESPYPVLHNRFAFRRRLLPPSLDLYDSSPNDPFSNSQGRVLHYASENYPNIHHPSVRGKEFVWPQAEVITSTLKSHLGTVKQQIAGDSIGNNTPLSTGSPAAASRAESTEPSEQQNGVAPEPAVEEDPVIIKLRQAEQRDLYAPVMPIDEAVSISIAEAARGDDRRARDMLGSIMLIGGGSCIPGFGAFLQDRLRTKDPYALAAAASGITFPEGPGRRGAPPHGDPKELIIIGTPPRDLDPQYVVWKGGSVFARLSPNGNECWITGKEYELLGGARMLAQKSLWNW